MKCQKICAKTEHSCGNCEQIFSTEEDLTEHASTHANRNELGKINCDKCVIVADDVTNIVNHTLNHHRQSADTCFFCGYIANSNVNMNYHLLQNQQDQEMLSFISGKLSEVTESFDLFEIFKTQLKEPNNQTNDTRLKDINISLQKLAGTIDERSPAATITTSALPPATKASPATLSPAPQNTDIPKVAAPKTTATRAPLNPEPIKPSLPGVPTSPIPCSKILFIGDSISSHADIDVLGKATKSKIVTSKAYSAVHDEVTNQAKEAAFFPKKNFLHVVPNEAVKDSYEHLIIQSGSVDISNLKTNVSPTDYLEYFKQEAVMSAKNIFQSCILALEHQPSLRSAVIMKQTPRYDPLDVAPLALKPALSHLFNKTLMELWISSHMKHKIFIGSHNIDCSGAIQSARYRHTKTGKFDGVHLYGSSGSKAYTKSVLNILKFASLISSDKDYHLSCAQYKYQNRNSSRFQGNY